MKYKIEFSEDDIKQIIADWIEAEPGEVFLRVEEVEEYRGTTHVVSATVTRDTPIKTK